MKENTKEFKNNDYEYAYQLMILNDMIKNPKKFKLNSCKQSILKDHSEDMLTIDILMSITDYIHDEKAKDMIVNSLDYFKCVIFTDVMRIGGL